jgi:phytoene dehydrogenase-like protein
VGRLNFHALKRSIPIRDAAVVGSGPNGLTAAILLQQAGFRTTLYEANPIVGGGLRTAELTLPGYRHDICSSIHPLAISSPIFRSFPLHQFGLEWIHPPIPVAHPMDDGTAPVLLRDLTSACARLGQDGGNYRRAVAPFVERWFDLMPDLLAPPLHLPARPLLLARFGALAAWPAQSIARKLFREPGTRALFCGIAGHAVMPLDGIGSGAFAWTLAIAAHAVDWPLPRGGSQSIANALAAYFESLGGRIAVNTRISSLSQLGDAKPVLFDLTPKQVLEIAGDRFSGAFRAQLQRYRYGPAAFKMDWALSAPIPWKAPECAHAGTVHLGGTLEEIAAAERAPQDGITAQKPFVLLTQPTQFDPTRAPAGGHMAWAYCHVPNRSPEDMSARIEAQIERFAPGFRSLILARHTFTPADLERHNANLVGGDIMGGAHTIRQLLFRPTHRHYRTPLSGLYLCSSSTPPGGGVHGMCGFHAAQLAVRDCGG